MAYLLYSYLRGSSLLWSRENRKADVFLFSRSSSSSYLGNMMLEQAPKCLFLCDQTQRTMGPRMLREYIFLERNSLSEALNLSLRSHLKGRMDFILFSFSLNLNFSILSSDRFSLSRLISCLLMILGMHFCLSAIWLYIQRQILSLKGYQNWQMRGMKSPLALQTFSIYRNLAEQYLLFILQKRLAFIYSISLCTYTVMFCLYLSMVWASWSLIFMCVSTELMFSLCSLYLLSWWPWCLELHFSSLQIMRLALQRGSQHTQNTYLLCSWQRSYCLPKTLNKQSIYHYLNSIMGNVCCQDDRVDNPLDKVQKQLTQQHGKMEFYQAQWPNDPYITDKINELKGREDLAVILQNQNVMKHKYLDKYYIGEWNKNGYPEGKGVMLEPGSYIYYGQFRAVPDGYGVLELFKERLVYDGELKEGRGEGAGKISSLDNKFFFQGTLSNSFPFEGKLTITNNDPTKSYSILLANFPNSKTKIEYGDGRSYEGFVNKRSFAPEGEGSATFPDGSHFQGYWQDGEMHGKGSFYWKDGSSYHGDYQHGKKHGEGTFNFVSKKHYEGQWANGKQHGRGVLYDPTDHVLKSGEWKDGAFVKSQSD